MRVTFEESTQNSKWLQIQGSEQTQNARCWTSEVASDDLWREQLLAGGKWGKEGEKENLESAQSRSSFQYQYISHANTPIQKPSLW